MKILLKKCTAYFTVLSMISSSLAFADNKEEVLKKKSSLKLNEIVLPSEVKKLSKAPSSIFYAPSVKDKVLIPVHFWGEVKKSGLHFVPVGTNLIHGLSLAGGPNATAKLEQVTLTRLVGGELSSLEFDLSDGGDEEVFAEIIQANDTIFVEKSRYYENRQYYTSLIGVVATFLSTILLYREVRKNRQ